MPECPVHLRKLLQLFGVAPLFLMALPSWGQQASPGWVRECPSDAFCFSRPVGLVAQPVQPIDSLTGTYRGGGVTLVFDMGAQADDGRYLEAPKTQDTSIHGKPARILSAGHQVMLVVPLVRESGPYKIRFAMSLQFDGKVQPELAQRIFSSIEFKPPR